LTCVSCDDSCMDTPGGSRTESRQDLSLRRFVRQAFEDLTNLDSRIWLTMRGLARPGHLAVEWCEGRGHRTLPPVRLYLIASALFFLFGSNNGVMLWTSADVATMLSTKTDSDLQSRFLQDAVLYRINSWTAVIRMASVVLFGLLLALLAPRGSPRVVPSLVLGTYYYTVSFLLATLSSLALAVTGGLFDESTLNSLATWLVNTERLLMLAWIVFAIRVAHQRPWPAAIALSLLILLVDAFLWVGAFGIPVGFIEETLDSG